MIRSWWKGLTEWGPLEKRRGNHFSILLCVCVGGGVYLNFGEILDKSRIPSRTRWQRVAKNWGPRSQQLFLFLFFPFFFLFFSFIFISWRLVTTLSGFCHTLTWISHGVTCIPEPDPPSHLPLYLIPLGLPSVPCLSTCFMHPTWAADLFHPT